MATRKKIPLINETANLDVTGTVAIAGSGAAVITFPTASCSFANPGTSGNIMQSNGTNWTSVAVATAIGSVFLAILPVGSTWYGGTNSANPSTYLPGHSGSTWVANALGQVIVGKAVSGTFATAGATGGAETVTLTAAQSGLPAHSHPIPYDSATVQGTSVDQFSTIGYNNTWANAIGTSLSSAANAAEAHNNLQPYKVEFIWTRTV